MEPSMLLWAGIAALVLVAAALLAFLASRLRTVGPDEALVVVSMGGGAKPNARGAASPRALADASNHTLHTNGRVFVLPIVQDAYSISLKQRQVELDVVGPDKNFVQVSVTGNLSFKFSDDPTDVLKAAQRFRGQPDEQVNRAIQQAAEGTLRSIVASMDYRSINADRAAFMEQALQTMKAELADQGIVVDILNIKSATAPGSTYAEDLAAAELADAKQKAAVARAESERVSQFAQLEAQQRVAERQRDLAIARAAWQAETDTAQAKAAAAGKIATQEQEALIAAKQRDALAAEALSTQERLDIEQKKPADAAAYAAAKKAEGEKQAAQFAAEADLYRRQKAAEAEFNAAKLATDAAVYQQQAEANAKAAATRAVAEADAAAGLARGNAEAEIARKVGEAEAAATRAKAEALASYGNDALAYEVVQRLPEIMEANAKALSGIGSYTVFGGSPSDAVNMAGQMLGQGLSVVKGVTGIDLGSVLGRVAEAKPSVAQPPAVTRPESDEAAR